MYAEQYIHTLAPSLMEMDAGFFAVMLNPDLNILGGADLLLASSSGSISWAGRFRRLSPDAVLEETVLVFTLLPFSSGPAGGETTYQGERLLPWRPKVSYSYLKDEGCQEDLLRETLLSLKPNWLVWFIWLTLIGFNYWLLSAKHWKLWVLRSMSDIWQNHQTIIP